jgi:chromosome segregation ATPase
LAVANQRAQALKSSLQARDGECARQRARLESLEVSVSEARARFDATSAAHDAERARLQEHYAAAENHWLREVDRARQHTQEAAREHQHQIKELRQRVDALQEERDRLRHDLVDVRTECKSARALREQLEQQLCATAPRSSGRLPQSIITERSPRRRKRKKAPKS